VNLSQIDIAKLMLTAARPARPTYRRDPGVQKTTIFPAERSDSGRRSLLVFRLLVRCNGIRLACMSVMPKSVGRIPLHARAAMLAVLPAVAGACAPGTLAMKVANPATGANSAGAMQAYEIPPYREDHRYEVTLAEWTPASLAFHVHFVNADRCGLPSSYSLDLVDDAGRRYPFHQTGQIHETTATGHLGATLHDSAIDGSFPVPIDVNTRFVVLQIRPLTGRDCNAVDFRWDFQAQQAPVAFQQHDARSDATGETQ
jgi:hypothetical protein